MSWRGHPFSMTQRRIPVISPIVVLALKCVVAAMSATKKSRRPSLLRSRDVAAHREPAGVRKIVTGGVAESHLAVGAGTEIEPEPVGVDKIIAHVDVRQAVTIDVPNERGQPVAKVRLEAASFGHILESRPAVRTCSVIPEQAVGVAVFLKKRIRRIGWETAASRLFRYGFHLSVTCGCRRCRDTTPVPADSRSANKVGLSAGRDRGRRRCRNPQSRGTRPDP